MLTIDPTQTDVLKLTHYLQSCIAPRPIALVSSINQKGEVNLSPFSFFNIFGTKPPTLIFSPNRRMRDGSTKHTLENVLVHDEVVINMVDYSMVQQMSLSSCEYAKGVNEFEKAGFGAVDSIKVKPPRVQQSKAAFECKVNQVIQMGQEGGAANLVICEIVLAHFDPSLLDEAGNVDQTKTDWVARLGGNWYTRASGDALFEVQKPNILLGVGVDAIPDAVLKTGFFSGNELGQLGNAHQLPDPIAIQQKISEQSKASLLQSARTALENNEVLEAWACLLAYSD